MDYTVTNYTLRVPVAQEVGQDVDFWMKKPATMNEVTDAVKDFLKHNLNIKNITKSEVRKFAETWGVWDEMSVKIKKGDDYFESHLAFHIDEHEARMEEYARLMAEDKEAELPENPTDGLIIVDPQRIGSFKARCGISDIKAG